MNTAEQALFLAGVTGELSTAGFITQSMNEGQVKEISDFASLDFVSRYGGWADLLSPVDALMAFREWLKAGNFQYITFKADLDVVEMSLQFRASDSATLIFTARSVPGDAELSSVYVSMYDQMTAAYDRFRAARSVGSARQSAGRGDDTQGRAPTSEVIDINSLRIEERNGKSYVRACGGRWTKFGVAVWPEVLDNLPFPWKTLGIGDNPVKISAEISLTTEGKPDKVLRFITK